MAYDPNDAKDKEIVDGLVAEAVEEATSGLKTKVEQLKGEKKKLQDRLAKGVDDPEVVTKLEKQLEDAQTALEKANADLKTATKDRDKATKGLETETAFTRNLLIDNGLTEALAKANVSTALMPGAKALLQGKVQIVTEGDKRVAKAGEKGLADFVSEWSQSDEGKAYVSVGNNGGGGANGGRANGGNIGKTMPRSKFDAMTQAERSAWSLQPGAQVIDG